MWEFIINAPIMNIDPFTGNSATYELCGEQKQARYILRYLKKLDIDLYQMMEKEAYIREKKEE